jgi:hypothetical protein
MNNKVLLYRKCPSKISFDIMDDPFTVVEIVIEHDNDNM